MLYFRRPMGIPPTLGALVLAIAVAACSSAATTAPSQAAAPSQAEPASAPASEAASAAASPSAEAPSQAAASPEASFDITSLDKALKAVSTLDSYQADIMTTNLSKTTPSLGATAIVIRKGDPSESELVLENGVLKFGVVYITSAGTGWVNDTGKTWKKVPLPTATQMIGTFTFLDPGVLLASILTDKVKPYLQTVGAETKNGQQTVHLHVDAASANLPASASFPPDGVADLWVSADGKYLVAATFSGTEKGVKTTFDYELTHINDASLKVVPPV